MIITKYFIVFSDSNFNIRSLMQHNNCNNSSVNVYLGGSESTSPGDREHSAMFKLSASNEHC
jgi:hypothetical protein